MYARLSMVPPWQAVVALAVAWSCCASDAARILAVEPMCGMSHWNFMSGVLQALLDNGHAVTAFTPFPGRHPPHENYTEVDISRELLPVRDTQLEDMVHMWRTPVGNVFRWVRISRNACDKIYGHPAMRDVLRNAVSHPPFDAVVVEQFLSDCVSYVAGRLRVPLIHVTPFPTIVASELTHTGHESNPATSSHVVAGHGVSKTFAQRLSNVALSVYCSVTARSANRALRYAEPREYDTLPPVMPSLVFVNGHYVTEPPNSVPPSVVHVGGIHLRPPQKLPKDILEFIEESSHGVIYFTFGSTVKMSLIPEHIKNAFVEVLAQIPQRVLWKYEDEIENKPKNIMIKKWLPQRDILMHPKVQLFISHGGISGLYEAVDAGVPVLGFPLFGDQHRNIDNLVNTEMAISMDLYSVSNEALLKYVLELINNEKYTINAKTASNIFKDRLITPAKSVVYWTEYVIRHKGAMQLNPGARNLTYYQYYLLDVIFFAIILISVFFLAIYNIFKYIYKCTLLCFNNVKLKIE